MRLPSNYVPPTVRNYQTTKQWVLDALTSGKIQLMIQGSHNSFINSSLVTSIQREDGSGQCFNVYFSDGSRIFVRTID